MDTTDKYIITHNKHMSYGEMARQLGLNKSTISRRAAALREAGELDGKPDKAELSRARAMRERLQGCTLDRAERLEALAELRELLHHDLTLAGGQGLARVSSEYRAVLAEIEALSAELGLIHNAKADVSTIELLQIRHGVEDEFSDVSDKNVTTRIVHAVFQRLADMDVINYTFLDMLRAEADQYDKGVIIKKRA